MGGGVLCGSTGTPGEQEQQKSTPKMYWLLFNLPVCGGACMTIVVPPIACLLVKYIIPTIHSLFQKRQEFSGYLRSRGSQMQLEIQTPQERLEIVVTNRLLRRIKGVEVPGQASGLGKLRRPVAEKRQT